MNGIQLAVPVFYPMAGALLKDTAMEEAKQQPI